MRQITFFFDLNIQNDDRNEDFDLPKTAKWDEIKKTKRRKRAFGILRIWTPSKTISMGGR